MNKTNLTLKKKRWSSDNVVVIRRRPRPKPAPVKPLKAKGKKKRFKKTGKPQKAKVIAPPPPMPPPKPKPPKPIKHEKPKSKKKRFKELMAFGPGVLERMNQILPPQPFKIGIKDDIFERLKNEYPGKRTMLRKALKFYLKRKTDGRHYLQAMVMGDHRNGLNGGKYPITKEHRERAKNRLIEKAKEYEIRGKNKGSNRRHSKRQRS